MSQFKEIVEKQVNSLRLKVDELEEFIDELVSNVEKLSNDYNFLVIIKLYTQNLKKTIESYKEGLSLFSSVNDIESILIPIRQELQAIQSILIDIHKPTSSYIPVGTFCMVEEIFKVLLNGRQKFFLNISSNSYSINFKFYTSILEHLKNNECEIEKNLEDPVIQINFLPIDKNDTLRNAIFAHEAGHAAIGMGVESKAANRNIYNYVKDKCNKYDLKKYDEQEEEVKSWISNKVLPFWIEEFVCDLIGVHLLGPAFIFSMIEIMEEDYGASLSSETHPPFFLRLKILLEFIKNEKYPDLIDKEINTARRYFSDDTFPRKYLPAGYQQLFDEVIKLFSDESITEISRLFREAKVPFELNWSNSKKNITCLADILKEGIVVTELREKDKEIEITSAEIMNAGWIVRLDRTCEIPYQTLNSLVDKAINLAFVKKSWKEENA